MVYAVTADRCSCIGKDNMDIKHTKPIHLKCPKCGYDFSCNSNHIEEEIDRLKTEITSIKSHMTQFKINYTDHYRRPAYKRMQAALNERQAQLAQYKKARKASNAEITMQINTIFRGMVRDKIGTEETNKLLKEAENQMRYYFWDNATQTYTRFEGV
jgi:superfamily II RNA helicase